MDNKESSSQANQVPCLLSGGCSGADQQFDLISKNLKWDKKHLAQPGVNMLGKFAIKDSYWPELDKEQHSFFRQLFEKVVKDLGHKSQASNYEGSYRNLFQVFHIAPSSKTIKVAKQILALGYLAKNHIEKRPNVGGGTGFPFQAVLSAKELLLKLEENKLLKSQSLIQLKKDLDENPPFMGIYHYPWEGSDQRMQCWLKWDYTLQNWKILYSVKEIEKPLPGEFFAGIGATILSEEALKQAKELQDEWGEK